MTGVILDLCAGSGAWSWPYVRAGYTVVEIEAAAGQDVRLLEYPGPVHGILAAPPCTMFAASGARWPRTTDDMLSALSVVDACLRLVTVCRPQWWALENPVGKLRRYLGPPTLIFDPCDFGDPWRKRTLLWGTFSLPQRRPVEPVEKSPIHYMSPGPDRAAKRSITSTGFARAFFEANP